MVRWMISTAHDDHKSMNFEALAMTLTRHICLTTRMIIMAPQCTHLRGGCFALLRKVLEFEELLSLGRYPLSDGHLYVHHLEKGHIRLTESLLSSKLPTPLLDLTELKELEQEQLDIDSLRMFRRAFTSQKTKHDLEEEKSALCLLTDIENMSQYLMQTIATDVHNNMPYYIHNMFTSTSAYRILRSTSSTVLPLHTESKVTSHENDLIGIPTLKPVGWKTTKTAIFRMMGISIELSEKPTTWQQTRKVITAKMAIERKEPSSKFVLLKEKVRNIHKNIRVLHGFQHVVDKELQDNAAAKGNTSSNIDVEKKKNVEQQLAELFTEGNNKELSVSQDDEQGNMSGDYKPTEVDVGVVLNEPDDSRSELSSKDNHDDDIVPSETGADYNDDMSSLTSAPSAVTFATDVDFHGVYQ